MGETLDIIFFFSVLGAFCWFCYDIARKRELQWKALAREFSAQSSASALSIKKKTFTEDSEIFEWELDGLKVAVTGGSKAFMTPFTLMPIIASGGGVCVTFSPPLPYPISIKRGSSALTGDPQFDRYIELTADDFWVRALKEDRELRTRIRNIVGSQKQLAAISQEAVALKAFYPGEFLTVAREAIELAKLLSTKGRVTPAAKLVSAGP